MSEKHILREFTLPSDIAVETKEKDRSIARFVMAPFERGFGTTVGNALRRTLMSSIQGFATTAVKITTRDKEGGQKFITSEFEIIEGIKEDTIEIFDVIKKMRFVVDDKNVTRTTVRGEFKGKEQFRCVAFEGNGIRILNSDTVLFTAVEDVDLLIELEVELGRGYLPSEETEQRVAEEGVIPIDALFSPVRNASFVVENVRIGHRNDYEKLIFTAETDGRESAHNAIAHGAKILKDMLQLLIHFDETIVEKAKQSPPIDLEMQKKFSLPVEELELSQRSSNCLKAANIFTLKDLTRLSEKEMEALPNFGKKSMDEVKEKLKEMELSLGMRQD